MDGNSAEFNKYIEMKEFKGNWFFYDKDIGIPDKYIAKIKPLNTGYCNCLWDEYISSRKKHLMLLDSNEWKSLIQDDIIIYNFEQDWNNNNYIGLQEVLTKLVPFNSADTIFFFWGRNSGVETTWEVFLKYWINFLFDDEGPVLINPDSNIIIIFGPTGNVIKGERIIK